MIHIYQGFCPDELQPDSRDPDCPACQVEAERNQLRAENARLTRELQIETSSTKMIRLQYEGVRAENARLTDQLQAVSDQLTEAVQRAQAAERELSKAQKGISYLARATEHAINYLASGVIDNESRINSLHNLKRWQHKSGVAKAD